MLMHEASYDFAIEQWALLESGVRDGRIHDSALKMYSFLESKK